MRENFKLYTFVLEKIHEGKCVNLTNKIINVFLLVHIGYGSILSFNSF